MLKARVRKDSRFAPITSCSGVSFFRDSWTNIPEGYEVEAKACEFLETKEFDTEPEPVEVLVDEEVEPEIEEAAEVEEKTEPVRDAPSATDEAISLAREMKVRLSWITGTGKNGKILIKDIEDYLAQKAD